MTSRRQAINRNMNLSNKPSGTSADPKDTELSRFMRYNTPARFYNILKQRSVTIGKYAVEIRILRNDA